MRFLTADEVRVWCEANGLGFSSRGYLHYDSVALHCFSVSIKLASSRVIALADHLVPTWNDVPGRGALFWIRERGVWGEFSEKLGATIIDQLRLANGMTESLEKRPGHLFEPEELFAIHSYFVLSLLFGWDAFLVPTEGDRFFFVSHDGLLVAVFRSEESCAQLKQRILDWSPREDKGWYFELACQ